MVRQALVVCVMAPPIHLGAWSLMLWLPIELPYSRNLSQVKTLGKFKLGKNSTFLEWDMHTPPLYAHNFAKKTFAEDGGNTAKFAKL